MRPARPHLQLPPMTPSPALVPDIVARWGPDLRCRYILRHGVRPGGAPGGGPGQRVRRLSAKTGSPGRTLQGAGPGPCPLPRLPPLSEPATGKLINGMSPLPPCPRGEARPADRAYSLIAEDNIVNQRLLLKAALQPRVSGAGGRQRLRSSRSVDPRTTHLRADGLPHAGDGRPGGHPQYPREGKSERLRPRWKLPPRLPIVPPLTADASWRGKTGRIASKQAWTISSPSPCGRNISAKYGCWLPV